jgi:hypothetical protein
MQVLAWMQPYLTDQFIRLAFHPDTFRTQPDLVERERAWSNQNPPYMFRAFHIQALSLFRNAEEYVAWLRAIQAPVLVTAGDKDILTPMVCACPLDNLLVAICSSHASMIGCWHTVRGDFDSWLTLSAFPCCTMLDAHDMVTYSVSCSVQEGMGAVVASHLPYATTFVVPTAGHQVIHYGM